MTHHEDFLAHAARRLGACDILAVAANGPSGEHIHTRTNTPGGSHAPHDTVYQSDTRTIRYTPSFCDHTVIAAVTWDELAKVIHRGLDDEDLAQLDAAYRRYAEGDWNATAEMEALEDRIIDRGLAAIPQQAALF